MANEVRLIDVGELVKNFRRTKMDEVFPNWNELGCVAKTAVIRLTTKYRAIILNAPTIDSESLRPKGRWEWFEEWLPSTPEHPRECLDCGWRCGECKNALEDMVGGYWDNPDEKPDLNYCPNCGAKMTDNGGRVR